MSRDRNPSRNPIEGNPAVAGEIAPSAPDSTESYRHGLYSKEEWRRTFGVKSKVDGEAQDTSLNVPDVFEPSPNERRQRRTQPETLAQASFPAPEGHPDLIRPGSHRDGHHEPAANVPIREAMSTIRAIISRVKGHAVVSPDDIAALNGAFDQLGAAAVACKELHNWHELAFIGHVRTLLGNYLGRKMPGSESDFAHADETDVAAAGHQPIVRRGMRADVESAGLVSSGDDLPRPRVDESMTSLFSTPARESNDMGAVVDQRRADDLEQIGIFIRQRERELGLAM